MSQSAIVPWLDGLTDVLLQASGEPWMLAALFALTVADALLPILPSETAVVALGALIAAGGAANLFLVVPVAALGAMSGDVLLFWIGRVIGTDRWSWMRRPRVASAFAWARHGLERRAATLIMTARYVPLGRIAVSLTAGASGFGFRRYAPISAVACISWAVYNLAVGAFFGTWFRENPLVAVVVSVAVAVTLGILIDVWSNRAAGRRATRTSERDEPDEEQRA